MKSKMVWVELSDATLTADVVRIFRNWKDVLASNTARRVVNLHRDVAVAEIRHQLWLRCGGACELCGDILTEGSGQMHEMKHRGKGGEISMENSVFICAKTHKREHADREPKFTRRRS